MRFGYWLPVFGGWLRNVDDERMEATWAYVSRLARRSEETALRRFDWLYRDSDNQA